MVDSSQEARGERSGHSTTFECLHSLTQCAVMMQSKYCNTRVMPFMWVHVSRPHGPGALDRAITERCSSGGSFWEILGWRTA